MTWLVHCTTAYQSNVNGAPPINSTWIAHRAAIQFGWCTASQSKLCVVQSQSREKVANAPKKKLKLIVHPINQSNMYGAQQPIKKSKAPRINQTGMVVCKSIYINGTAFQYKICGALHINPKSVVHCISMQHQWCAAYQTNASGAPHINATQVVHRISIQH